MNKKDFEIAKDLDSEIKTLQYLIRDLEKLKTLKADAETEIYFFECRFTTSKGDVRIHLDFKNGFDTSISEDLEELIDIQANQSLNKLKKQFLKLVK